MRALGIWLIIVGSLRLLSVWLGFFRVAALRTAVFSNCVFTEAHGRTFGVWTLLTCTLCFVCAFDLRNKLVYVTTFLSFLYALAHFWTEYLIYDTMGPKGLTTITFFAGTSVVWMATEWIWKIKNE